jgi:hypothetical protein
VDQPPASLGAALNRDLIENYERVERVEQEIDLFIERRSRQEQAARREAEMWEESVRKYNVEQRRKIRAQWCEYHLTQAERLRSNLVELISYHEQQASRLSPPPTDAA